MPDFVTHHLFGHLILSDKALPPQIKGICSRHTAAFFWGLQGPDPLYYHRVLRGGSDLNAAAREMHHLYTAQLMEEWTKQVLCAPLACKEALFAYFCGFLCHYACDAAMHPYVYCKQAEFTASNPQLSKSGAHAYVEGCIDAALYRKMTGKDVTGFSFGKQFTLPQGVKNVIGKSYSVILQKLYQKDISVGEVEQCFSDALSMQRLFYGDHSLAAKAVGFGERFKGKRGAGSGHFKLKDSAPDWDALNLQRSAWRPANSSALSFDSVPMILSNAAQHAVNLIEIYHGMIKQGKGRFVALSCNFCGEAL